MHPRQRLADLPVLLPRLARRAPVDPGRARRGGAGRRRRRRWQIFRQGHAAAAADRRRAAADRVVRLQLQQLQQHLPAHRRRPAGGGPVRRGRDRHPDHLHVQARVRVRQGAATTGSRARSRSSSSSSSARSPAIAFWRAGVAGEHRVTTVDSRRARRRAEPAAVAKRRRAPRPTCGGTWWRHLVAIVAVVFALFPVAYVASAAFNADRDARRRVADPARASRSTTSARSSRARSTIAGDVSDIPLPRWYANTLVVAAATALLTRPARRARGVRVQPLPLPGAAAGDADAAPDPDVPAAAGASSRST